jgi:hypothetical protein
MTDRDLLAALLESTKLTELELEAFTSMADWLDGGKHRQLSTKQREWAHGVAVERNLVADENLFSSGKVPRGIPMKKTRGEEIAVSILNQRPLAPPGRTAR